MSLQSFVRWFLPKEDRWFEFLEKQAVITDEGAQALATWREPEVSAAMVRERVQEKEHAGDKLVHQMEEALARTFGIGGTVNQVPDEWITHFEIATPFLPFMGF